MLPNSLQPEPGHVVIYCTSRLKLSALSFNKSLCTRLDIRRPLNAAVGGPFNSSGSSTSSVCGGETTLAAGAGAVTVTTLASSSSNNGLGRSKCATQSRVVCESQTRPHDVASPKPIEHPSEANASPKSSRRPVARTGISLFRAPFSKNSPGGECPNMQLMWSTMGIRRANANDDG